LSLGANLSIQVCRAIFLFFVDAENIDESIILVLQALKQDCLHNQDD